jgi:hypothetical protein
VPDFNHFDGAVAQPGDLFDEPLHLAPQREPVQARFRARPVGSVQLQLDKYARGRAEFRLAISDLQFFHPAEVDRLKQPEESLYGRG